jgi:hypothetical protein
MTRRVALKLGTLTVVCFFLLGLGAQVNESPLRYRSLPEDWSHHHIVFTRNGLAAHPDLINREPRALHQILRRAAPSLAVTRTNLAASSSTPSGAWSVSTVGGRVPITASPAKFTFDPTAVPDCTNDFVVFGLNAAGSTSQATIIALKQLYVNAAGTGHCAGATAPSFLFAYNASTLTGGVVRNSPALSLDGKKIAFVESTTTQSVLHVLTWESVSCGPGKNCNAGNPTVPGVGNTAKLVSVTYAAANNTHSSPWIDYVADTIYVGADDGKLYKLTGVFKTATPTLVTTGGWPIQMQTGGWIGSPILDNVSSHIFVGDQRGFLDSVNYITPGTVSHLAVGKAGQLNAAVFDAPIVDGTNGTVFATSANDGVTGGVIVEASTANLAPITTLSLGLASHSGTGVVLYDGDFDNNYINSVPSGFMLACGTGSADITPHRYHMGFIGTTIQPDPASVQILPSTRARCGPITEFFNPNIAPPGTDFFFWGITRDCVGTTGCIMSLSGSTVTTAAETGGTSAVVIDNQSTLPATSNIYFTTEGGLPARAASLSQNGLN